MNAQQRRNRRRFDKQWKPIALSLPDTTYVRLLREMDPETFEREYLLHPLPPEPEPRRHTAYEVAAASRAIRSRFGVAIDF